MSVQLKQIISWVLIVCLNSMFIVVAKAQTNSALKDANDLYNSLQNTNVFEQNSDGTFTSNGVDFDANELFPGTSAGNTSPEGTYFPAGETPQTATFQSITTKEQLDNADSVAKTSLWEDSQSDSPSIQGQVYQILVDKSNLNPPDLTNDPMFNQTLSVVDDLDNIAENLSDCSVESVLSTTKKVTHIPEYERCTRVVKPEGACRIDHVINIETEPTDILFLVDNSASMGAILADLRSNVGLFAQLLQQGSDEKLRVAGISMRTPSNRTGFSYGSSSFQRWINALGENPGATAPFDSIASGAATFTWRDDVNRVIVLIGNDDSAGNFSAAKGALTNYGIDLFTFHNNGSVKSLGTSLGNYFSSGALLKFAQFFTVVSDSWTPQQCMDAAIISMESFCDGSYTPSPVNDNTCQNLSGFTVCKGDQIYNQLKEPPIPNVAKLSMQIDVSALTCDYNIGSTNTTWIDPQGNTQRLENFGDIDQCKEYSDNNQCGYISSECIDGATGEFGNCYVWKDTYDCGVDIEVNDYSTDQVFECAGEIQCQGDDCINVSDEHSESFGKAMAMLQMAQGMGNDMDCVDSAGVINNDCEIFKGEEGECKIAVGGVQDCCEKPKSLDFRDYLTLMSTAPKLDAALMSETGGFWAGTATQDSYKILRGDTIKELTNVADAMLKPFSTSTSSINTTITGIETSIDAIIDETIAEIQKGLTEAWSKAFGEESAAEVASALGFGVDGGVDSGVNSVLSDQVMSAYTTISAVYFYYTVAMLTIQIVWACEEGELAMNSQRALKNCHYVGSYCKTEVFGTCIEERESYCCFNSPLSRIIQEQIRPQIGGWGDAENPMCGGVMVSQLNNVDWTNVDLSEYMAMLTQYDLAPVPELMNVEHLTGDGNEFNFGDEGRDNVIERNNARFEDANIDDAVRAAKDSVTFDVTQ